LATGLVKLARSILVPLLSNPVETPLDALKVDDFLQELAAIQESGSKRIAILGSRHVPITHCV